MKFSLLFNNTNLKITDAVAPASEGLLIERLLFEFEQSPERRDNFLKVIATRSNRESAIRRQDILRDFLSQRELLDDLHEMLISYDDMRKDWQELRSALGAYASMKATADFIRSTVAYFKSVYDMLTDRQLNSEGLVGLRDWLLDMSRNNSLDELNRVAELFKRDSMDAYEWSVHSRLDSSLAVSRASVSDIDEIIEVSLLKRVFRKKIEDGSIDLGEFHAEQSRSMLSEALYELYRALTAVAGALYEVFHGLSKELDFYTTAVKFCDYISSNEMYYVFPEFQEYLTSENSYDPLLLTEGLMKEQIITNSMRFGDFSGVIIRGANAAGKTSLIRAMGLLCIFAAAGLPVCAKEAKVPFFDYVHAQFSKSEQLGKLDEAGRFEQEVKELADIYHVVGKGDLVLLNETFQTTSYAEGAEAIRHILAAIERSGARWIFVSHLTPLLENPPVSAAIVKMENFKLSVE